MNSLKGGKSNKIYENEPGKRKKGKKAIRFKKMNRVKERMGKKLINSI